jgi:hypothetical protein
MSSNSDLQAVAAQVLKATVPEDVFGDVPGTAKERLRAIRQVYRRTMVLVHPDRFTGDDVALANDCATDLFNVTPWGRIIETQFPETVAEMLNVPLAMTSYGPTFNDKVTRCQSTKS